jgi:hypothetical protein
VLVLVLFARPPKEIKPKRDYIVNGWRVWLLGWTLDTAAWLPEMLKALEKESKDPVASARQLVTASSPSLRELLGV